MQPSNCAHHVQPKEVEVHRICVVLGFGVDLMLCKGAGQLWNGPNHILAHGLQKAN